MQKIWVFAFAVLIGACSETDIGNGNDEPVVEEEPYEQLFGKFYQNSNAVYFLFTDEDRYPFYTRCAGLVEAVQEQLNLDTDTESVEGFENLDTALQFYERQSRQIGENLNFTDAQIAERLNLSRIGMRRLLERDISTRTVAETLEQGRSVNFYDYPQAFHHFNQCYGEYLNSNTE